MREICIVGRDARADYAVQALQDAGYRAMRIPLSEAEVASMGVEQTKVSGLPFAVGDSVKIMEGPLSGFIGRVEDISADQKTVKIAASMFGRETIVELEPTAVHAIKD